MTKLTTSPARSQSDVAAFFDAWADHYGEQHGRPEHLLKLRLSLIERSAQLCPEDTVLEVGCGTGRHLLALAGKFGRGIGIDLSAGMIRTAQKALRASTWGNKITFRIDRAEELATVPDQSLDVALFVGSLEHILEPDAALGSVFRTLRPEGRLVILTPNAGFVWYKLLAPLLRWDTQHLATDHFFSRREINRILKEAGFEGARVDFWSFIPKGDMNGILGLLLEAVDKVGRILLFSFLRGGLLVRAQKPT